MKCKHNLVRSGYGDDLICTKCGYAFKQASLKPIAAEMTKPALQPVLREKVEIPVYNGEKVVRISVFKDELLKQLSINHSVNRLGC